MIRATGLLRKPRDERHALNAARPYHADLSALSTVLQPVFCLHDQGHKPSCTGQSLSSGIEPHVNTRLSAVDLWTDARRREGRLEDPTAGTYIEDAIESVIRRGVSKYVAGEDYRDWAEDQQIATQQQELDADKRRISVTAVHRTINGWRAPQLVDALWRGYACSIGAGLKEKYFTLWFDAIADETCIGGDDNGHAQRVIGYIAPDDTRFPEAWRNCFIILNSWPRWGGLVLTCPVTRTDGFVLPAGFILDQCTLVPAHVIEDHIWTADALQVVFAP